MYRGRPAEADLPLCGKGTLQGTNILKRLDYEMKETDRFLKESERLQGTHGKAAC